MEEIEELNMWNEAMTPVTPRRTIYKFFDKATPVDSPDVEEIFEPPVKCIPPEEEATPVAGNSQNSQRSQVLKRKFADDGKSFGNISKKKVNENQITSLHNDSTFGTSEFSPSLESPNFVILPRPQKKDKKRMSTTAFVEAIKSQQTQVVNTSDNLGESSIPSALGSPEKVFSQRVLRSKKHTSVSMFQETLGGKNIQEGLKNRVTLSGLNESDLESSGNPSKLESPEYVSSQNRFIHKSKQRRSTTAFKQVLENQKEQDSEEILPSLDSFEKEQPVDRFVSKSKVRMSSTAFKQVLENKKEQDSEEILHSLDSPEKKQPVDRSVQKSRSRMSRTAFKQVLENQKEQDSEEILHSLDSPEKEQPTTASVNVLENEPNEEEVVLTEVFPDLQRISSDEQDYSGLPELEIVESFPSVPSSAQINNSKLPTQNSLVDPGKETLSKQSDQFCKDGLIGRLPVAVPISSVSINNSTLETPSQLGSPNQHTQYIRPGPASYKKRVSATGFLVALSQKNDVVSSLDHVKEPTQEISIRVDEEIEMSSRPSSRLSNKSSSSLEATKLRKQISLRKLFETDEKKEAISDVIRNINESLRSVYPVSSNPSPTPKSRDRLSNSTDSDSDNELPFSKTETLPADKTAKINLSASRASDSTLVSIKSSSSDGTAQGSIISDDGESDNEILFPKTETPTEENIGKISRNASRASRKTLALTKSNDKTTRHSKSNDTDSDNNLPFSKTETPQLKNTAKTTLASRSSKRKSTSTKLSDRTTVEEGLAVKSSRTPNISLPKFSKIVLNSESESENSEVSLLMPINEHTSTKIRSPLHAAIGQAKLSSSSSSFGSRSRKTLNFNSLITKVDSTAITTIVDHQPLIDEAGVEETASSETDSTDQISEEEKSTEEIEDEEELSEKSKGATHSLRASAGMSPSNRYPALKNSTVVAGGAAFYGAPLSMSPIKPDEHGAPLLLLSTPKSSEAGTGTGTDVISPTPKTVQQISSHPSTPAPFRKRTSSITQSPMFMNVMKSSVKKAISNVPQNQQRVISATPTTSRVFVAKTVKSQQSLVKGLSTSNPRKGKSIVVSPFDKMPESSDTEWEDEEVGPQPKPRCINIAFEEIEDRSKDFVPLEKRLMADPVFQAKVKIQRAKVAAEKAADEAVATAKKNAKRLKPRTVAANKKEEDNIANVATNKGNLRFYARTKVSKEALDAVHGFVGEWFDFTLDQMENFCIDEGISSLNSWEDCYKMMKRQGIVKNYMEYSGLCHSLLLNDECAQLLPSSYPPEFYDWKREAKRQKK